MIADTHRKRILAHLGVPLTLRRNKRNQHEEESLSVSSELIPPDEVILRDPTDRY